MHLQALLVLFFVVPCCAIEVKLSKRSTLYLPYTYSENGTALYEFQKVAIEQTSYDAEEKILYGVGDTILHAIDVSNPDNMTIKAYVQYPGIEFTDVEFCGGYVFAACDNQTVRAEGKVIIFSAFNGTLGSMAELMQIPVGAVPDMVKPTHHCSKLVVAVEGEAYELPANAITDPPGKITIITFPDGVNSNYSLVPLDFQRYNDRVDELSESGVRHVYRDNDNPFSNDVEPEYITFNNDDTKAYVSLQENNAIAVVDLLHQNISKIHGLGFKNWSMYSLDPSNKDKGAFMNSYSILGMYCPDTIAHFTFKGDNYIATANEGDSKDYIFGNFSWTEEVRGKDIPEAMKPVLDSMTSDQLSKDFLLGRMKFAASPAEKDASGRLKALYSYGGRSFTIRRADDMSVVYDSGDDISRQIYKHNPALFNTQVLDPMDRPIEGVDERSDDKGAETEALSVAEVDGVTLFFIGNERPGIIHVYSFDSDITKPRFHYLYESIPHPSSKSWKQLYDEGLLSEVDPEDLHFVPASKSPTGKPILFATGSISGTVSIIDVIITESPTAPPETTREPCISVGNGQRASYFVSVLSVMMLVVVSFKVDL